MMISSTMMDGDRMENENIGKDYRSNNLDNFQCEEYIFSSNFDSGNLGRVEFVQRNLETGSSQNIIHVEFNVWTTPDCYGTIYESPNRTWFFFSIKGGEPYRNVKINVKNLNRQSKLFAQGMQPVVKIGEYSKWERIKNKPTYNMDNENFVMSFIHQPMEKCNLEHYYAFTYPFTYGECQNMLEQFDKQHKKNIKDINYIIMKLNNEKLPDIKTSLQVQVSNDSNNKIFEDEMNMYNEEKCTFAAINSSFNDFENLKEDYAKNDSVYVNLSRKQLLNEIYYHREPLVYSLEGRRVDLITITSFHGIQGSHEERIGNLFPDLNCSRCHTFKNKKIIFMSSRVHPGETPASFVLNGFLKVLLDKKSIISQTLRQLYVFKIVPILNPDGVYRGFYRTDTLGQNLNRMYDNPKLETHPSIYAVKKIIMYYHCGLDIYSSDNSSETSSTSTSVTKCKHHSINSTKNNTVASTARMSSTSLNNLGLSEFKDNINIHSQKSLIKENIENCRSKKEKRLTETLVPRFKTNTTQQKQTTSITNIKHERTSTVANSHDKITEAFHQQQVLAKKNIEGMKDTRNINIAKNSFVSCSKIGNKNILSSHNTNNFAIKSSSTPEIGVIHDDTTNMFLYIDFHGHASKKGVFMYGNHFSDATKAAECQLLPKLMSLNSHHFHYDACNFSEKNMYRREKRDGLSKEGCGRVAVYKMTGLIKSYTLESNYNTGNYVNSLPTRANIASYTNRTTKAINLIPPKYTPAIYEEVGRALGSSILDLTNTNYLSRVPNSEFRSIQSLRLTLKNEIEKEYSVTQRKTHVNSTNSNSNNNNNPAIQTTNTTSVVSSTKVKNKRKIHRVIKHRRKHKSSTFV